MPREDPLVAALREENEYLRSRNHHLAMQLAAAQTLQEEIGAVLRLTAPLRRLQELARHRRQDRRRRTLGDTAPAHVARAETTSPPATSVPLDRRRAGVASPPRPHVSISDAQAERYPLLARTRTWAAGGQISRPEMRPLRTGRRGRVLVVAHVFYPEIWPDLARRIRLIPVPYDVVVTLVEGASAGLLDQIVAEFPGVVIETLPNRGRDMWPLARVTELGLVGDYDAVLKLHTKRSVHRLDGAAWRDRLLDSLCPSPEGIALILELLKEEPAVGMVAPAGAVLGREFWGGNAVLVEALAARTGVTLDPDSVWFPGGSMFWSRPEHLNRLRDTALTAEDFEHDLIVLDSTTAHALERFLGVLVGSAGQSVVGTNEVASRLARARLRPGHGLALPREPVRVGGARTTP